MERNEVESKYKWKVEDIYPSDEAWEKAYSEAEKSLNFSGYKGKLGKAECLREFYRAQEEAMRAVERLYLYAHMRHDEDSRIAKYTAMQSRAMSLIVRFSSETAFVEPELTALPDSVLEGYLRDSSLSDHDYALRQLIKMKKHILSEKEEKLLAMGGEVYSQFQNIFSMIDNADIQLGEVEDGKGGKIALTHGMYSVLLHGDDRDLRRRAFERYYAAYIGLTNTIAATYYGNVKKDVFISRARGYESCLQRALDGEDVGVCVYNNLIEAVRKNLPAMHRYIALRKKILKLDEQHMYDIYAPLVADAELKLSYEEACDLVVKGLSPLGEDYCSLLKRGFAEGWVDVCETSGKRSGAYSTGIFGLHPYVLLNYQKTTHDVFTIAHEMGHALHTYHSNAKQPYAKADYRIFVAEVASTVNETLLLKYILSTTQDENMKKYLLNYFLDTIRTTLHRQTMFAEFESIAHGLVEAGTPLTSENLSAEYLKLNKQYYGDAIVHDEQIAYEWSRIPHFYTSFYVYKYATGIISAISIVNRILTEGETAVRDYKEFLSSGGSDSPVELLKIAGVDLTKPQAFEAAMKEFEDTLARFEEMMLKK
mgnify:FL=1